MNWTSRSFRASNSSQTDLRNCGRSRASADGRSTASFLALAGTLTKSQKSNRIRLRRHRPTRTLPPCRTRIPTAFVTAALARKPRSRRPGQNNDRHHDPLRQRYESDYEYWDLAAQWKLEHGAPACFCTLADLTGSGEALVDREFSAETTRREFARSPPGFAAQASFRRDFAHYFGIACDSNSEPLRKGSQARSLCEGHGILQLNEMPLRLV